MMRPALLLAAIVMFAATCTDRQPPTSPRVQPILVQQSASTEAAGTIEDVISELRDFIEANPGSTDKLEDVIEKLQTAAVELNKTPPDNQAAAGAIEGAVGDLEAASSDAGVLDPVQGREHMDRLAGEVRRLAEAAIEAASARGGDPIKIAEAMHARDEGDDLRGNGTFKAAVNKYKDALAKAEGAVQQTTGTVGDGGGFVELPGVGSALFPTGAFPGPRAVTMQATSAAEVAADFELTVEAFSAGPRMEQEVRVQTGEGPPATPFEARLAVPAAFVASLPPGFAVAVFAEVFQDGGDEILDDFELYPSTFDAASGVVRVELPPEVFTDRRTADGPFEAIIVIGSRPSAVGAASVRTLSPQAVGGISDEEKEALRARRRALAGGSGSPTPAPARVGVIALANGAPCEAAILGPPLGGPLTVRPSGVFDGVKHKGTDYVAADGDPVFSMADGTILRIGFDVRPLPVPDPRSGKLVKGWGRYVRVKHADGSITLYGHLQEHSTAHLSVGQEVSAGTLIGNADNTGGSSAPHLHVEYRRADGRRIDPQPCIAPDVDFQLSTIPFDPGPFEDYGVLAVTVPPRAGVAATMTIVGSDGYTDTRSGVTDAGGVFILFVPGSNAGVVDVTTATIGARTMQITIVF